MRLKPTVLCLTLALLALPSTAAAKSQYGLRLGESISVQGELAPTLFAGNPCVEVVADVPGDGGPHEEAGVTAIEADREYWQMALFSDGDIAELEASRPSLVLRDLATGDEVSIVAGTVEGNGIDPYMPLSIRFPHAGRWSVALDDGSGNTFDYADGTVISTMNSPVGTPLDAAELEALGDPGTCSETKTAAAGPGGDSIVAPLAIGVGVAGLVALAWILRRRSLA